VSDERLAMPAPRKCDTPGCDAPPRPPDWDPEGIDQSDGKQRAWTWRCVCGWAMTRPVTSAFVSKKEEVAP
jgi:hypothetical protein